MNREPFWNPENDKSQINYSLDRREVLIIRMRQGNYVDSKGKRYPKMTLREIARFWNITPERVRQIERGATYKLMGCP